VKFVKNYVGEKKLDVKHVVIVVMKDVKLKLKKYLLVLLIKSKKLIRFQVYLLRNKINNIIILLIEN